MRRRAALLLLLLAGCGEVETLELAVRPRQDDFGAQIQPLLEHMGCNRAGGCHTQPVGELQIVASPDGDQLQSNYLGVKSKVSLEDPEKSPILTDLLGPDGPHRPHCWASTQSCGYRKLLAWISWTQASDPRPQDVACDLAAEQCP
jgi:hypothetical protein